MLPISNRAVKLRPVPWRPVILWPAPWWWPIEVLTSWAVKARSSSYRRPITKFALGAVKLGPISDSSVKVVAVKVLLLWGSVEVPWGSPTVFERAVKVSSNSVVWDIVIIAIPEGSVKRPILRLVIVRGQRLELVLVQNGAPVLGVPSHRLQVRSSRLGISFGQPIRGRGVRVLTVFQHRGAMVYLSLAKRNLNTTGTMVSLRVRVYNGAQCGARARWKGCVRCVGHSVRGRGS
uniref:Uncharacterized protein n=1 Tax=Cacopsylla melanoneura TaxID=428564 RepID=A0A8D8ZBG8_9HEMI